MAARVLCWRARCSCSSSGARRRRGARPRRAAAATAALLLLPTDAWCHSGPAPGIAARLATARRSRPRKAGANARPAIAAARVRCSKPCAAQSTVFSACLGQVAALAASCTVLSSQDSNRLSAETNAGGFRRVRMPNDRMTSVISAEGGGGRPVCEYPSLQTHRAAADLLSCKPPLKHRPGPVALSDPRPAQQWERACALQYRTKECSAGTLQRGQCRHTHRARLEYRL